MKLAAITDEISMDFAHALDVMKEYGCTAAELRGLWDVNVGDLTDAQVDETRRILDAKGMQVCCIASPLFKCELGGAEASGKGPMHLATERAAAEQMDLVKRCAHLARLFGTEYVRIFSFWRHGPVNPEVEEAMAAGISDAVKYAEDNAVVLLMENENSCYLGTGVETGRFLDRFGSPALKGVWDPGNAFLAGERPFPDGYAAIRNHVVHVHVKDAEVLASGKQRFTVVGEGEVDYKGQIAALTSDGYNGYYSLETHYRPFAGTAEQASRLCLQGLAALLAG